MTGGRDINADPLFLNQAAGDLHLQPNSPCIDAGYDEAVPSWLLADLDGSPRIRGACVDVGAYEFQSAPGAYTIGQARASTDGTPVDLAGAIVTAVWQDVFYIERSDRACGVRVSKPGHDMVVGQTVAIAGIMATTADGERMILAISASGGGGQPLAAIFVPTRLLGGTPSANYSIANGTGQQGVVNGAGLNNIGLLVSLYGRVTFVDPGGEYIAISDGSLLSDIDGHSGVRVSAAGLIPPGLEVGDFVTVTGVVSCSKSGSDLYPKVLARDPIQVHN